MQSENSNASQDEQGAKQRQGVASNEAVVVTGVSFVAVALVWIAVAGSHRCKVLELPGVVKALAISSAVSP